MVRRLFVPAIVAALILGVAPAPSFGLADDHYRCMYRCDERGGSFRPAHHEPASRRAGPRKGSSWPWPPRPRPGPRPPARPSWQDPRCWLFCGGDRGPIWSGPHQWCGPGPYYLDDDWYGHRPCRPHRPGWSDDDRYRDHDGRGYDAHRHHPRDGDF
jgi:hypothetical protein